jgi:hypothetical protein
VRHQAYGRSGEGGASYVQVACAVSGAVGWWCVTAAAWFRERQEPMKLGPLLAQKGFEWLEKPCPVGLTATTVQELQEPRRPRPMQFDCVSCNVWRVVWYVAVHEEIARHLAQSCFKFLWTAHLWTAHLQKLALCLEERGSYRGAVWGP